MSDMIRKITGINGTNTVNYIPVVYYCVCDTAANDIGKKAYWIGNSNGNQITSNVIKLYKGATFAILFTNGFGKSRSSSGIEYKLNINGTGEKDILLSGTDNNLNFVEPNTVVLFSWDGNQYRVINGVTGAQLAELKDELIEAIEQLRQGKVDLEADTDGGYKAQTGNADQPIYVTNRAVKAITNTFGRDDENKVQPIWIEEGHFKGITSTVGSATHPVYISGGTIVPISTTVGGQTVGAVPNDNSGAGYDTMQPIFSYEGKLTKASVDIGSPTIPIHMEDGVLKRGKADVGSVSTPIYMSKGVIRPFNKSIGGQTVGAVPNNNSGAGYDRMKPIFVNGGTLTEASVDIGSPTIPIFMNDGELTRTTANVGNISVPVYLDKGQITKLSVTAGGETTKVSMKPVYVTEGQINEASVDVGDDVKPLKMKQGNLIPVTNDLATKVALDTEIAERQAEDVVIHTEITDQTAHGIKLISDSQDFKYTFQLTNGNNTAIGNSVTINLPLESVVTGGSYSNGIISLKLQNGNSITFPVTDIQNGLVKDPGTQGVGSSTKPVYVDSNGNAVVCDYDLGQITGSIGSSNFILKAVAGTPSYTATTSTISTFSANATANITATLTIPTNFTHLQGTLDLAVQVTGILPISHGGTGASTAADARTNLGLGTAATHAHSDYKTKQTVITGSATASGTATAFITNITQNANGEITRTAASLPTASASTPGIMKLGASGGAAAYGHTHDYSKVSITRAYSSGTALATVTIDGTSTTINISSVAITTTLGYTPASTNSYHTAGTYTPTATGATSGLKTNITSATGAGTITLNVPVYWGSSAPTAGLGVTGAIYVQV